MPDIFSKETRSKIMSQIRSKNTNIELLAKKIFKGTNLRFHPKIYGKPDFGLKSKKIAIFIDGCFWHKCPNCYKEPKSNTKYWLPKIQKNVLRDKEVSKKLKSQGFKAIRIWEHEMLKNPKKCLNKIKKSL